MSLCQIISLEQLIRYQHLNSLSAGIVPTIDKLPYYQWSSYPAYIGLEQNKLIQTHYIMSHFDFDPKRYEKFVTSHAPWQKRLEVAKHRKK